MMPKGVLFVVMVVGLMAVACFAEETYEEWKDEAPPSFRMEREDMEDPSVDDDEGEGDFEPYQILHIKLEDQYMDQVEFIDPDDMGTFIIKEISKYPMAKVFMEHYTEHDLSDIVGFINEEIDMEGRNDLVQTLLKHHQAAEYGYDLVEAFLYIPSYANTEHRNQYLREMTEWVDRHVESPEANAGLKMSLVLLQDGANVVKEFWR